MKLLKISLWMMISFFIISCSSEKTQKDQTSQVPSEVVKSVSNQSEFGVQVVDKMAISMTELDQLFIEKSKVENITLKGEVEEVCQKKGCWMKLKTTAGENIRVTFKDYALFMPKDIAGKEVIVHGFGEITETSVASLRHFAEDAGQSKEEIEKITEPEKKLTFEADGVKIL